MSWMNVMAIVALTVAVAGCSAGFHVAQEALERWVQHRHAGD